MNDPVVVSPIGPDRFEEVLPLIADYQRFYGATPEEARNREFFARFLDPSDQGALLGAWSGDTLLGHACLYFTFSSVEATEVVLMNDLFVVADARGRGVGRALIGATVEIAAARGIPLVRWMTGPDNLRAQRLYDRTGASRSSWFEYELAVDPAG